MTGPGEREIDVLDALGDGVEALLEAIERADAGTDYMRGQRAFFEGVLAAIDTAGPEERPQAVLEGVGADLGLKLEDHRPVNPPLDERRAGVLAAWGICIGYVEGVPAGARAVISTVDDTAGLSGSLEER